MCIDSAVLVYRLDLATDQRRGKHRNGFDRPYAAEGSDVPVGAAARETQCDHGCQERETGEHHYRGPLLLTPSTNRQNGWPAGSSMTRN